MKSSKIDTNMVIVLPRESGMVRGTIGVIVQFHLIDLIVDIKAGMPGIQQNISLGFHPVVPQVRMMNTIMCLGPSEGLKGLIKGLTRDVIHVKVALDAD